MFDKPNALVTVSVLACTGLWAAQAPAAGTLANPSSKSAQTRQQLRDLQKKVQKLQDNMAAQPKSGPGNKSGQTSVNTGSGASQNAPQQKKQKKNKKSLTIGGAVITEYQIHDNEQSGQRTGGNLILDYLDLNFAGDAGHGVTFAADYRWSTVNFGPGNQYLHNGWAAYDFGGHDSSQIKGGFFQIPFGNLTYGYESFWGNLVYYTGFTDNQSAGLGYKYEASGFRMDIDAFKNDDLEQFTTYGSNPVAGYDQINGGAVRLAYTFNKGGDYNLDISAAARGGQLEVGESGSAQSVDSFGNTITNDNGNPITIGQSEKNGTRWAATVAAKANLGDWVLMGQAIDYRYNVPEDTQFNGADVSRDSITFENYGFKYRVPASGQIYAATVLRKFQVGLGPIDSFSIYDDYGYLAVGGDGRFNSALPGGGVNSTGDPQFNVFGVKMVAGPIYIWAEWLAGKNSTLTFDGPDDGDFHHRFNLTVGYYFSGDVL